MTSRLTIAIDSALQLEEGHQRLPPQGQQRQEQRQQQGQQLGQELEQEQEQLSMADGDLQEIYREFLFPYDEVN
jgi:hypothetical protein